MSASPANSTTVTLPADLAQRLHDAAKSMGVDLVTYLVFLDQCRQGRLDQKSQDATRYVLRQHEASLRKLAQ